MNYSDTAAAGLAWSLDAIARTNGTGRVVAEAHVHDDGSTVDGQPVTLVQSYNIQSVVRTGTGIYVVTPAAGISAAQCAHSVEYLGADGSNIGLTFSTNAAGNTLNVTRYNLTGGPENGAFTVSFMGNPISVPVSSPTLLHSSPALELSAGSWFTLGAFAVSIPKTVQFSLGAFVSSGTLVAKIVSETGDVAGSTITLTGSAAPQTANVSVTLPTGNYAVLCEYTGTGLALVQEIDVT